MGVVNPLIRLLRTTTAGVDRSLKGSQNRLEPLGHVVQPAAVGLSHDFVFVVRQRVSRPKQTLSADDVPQHFNRIFQLIVHENVVVTIVILDFTAGGDKAALNYILGILASLS